jgi:hypothetical protein
VAIQGSLTAVGLAVGGVLIVAPVLVQLVGTFR